MADMTVANTIRDQVGHQALYMMGAKNLAGDGSSLTWKVGRNAKGVTHVKVTLDPTDTYTVRFIKVGRAPKHEIRDLAEHSMVYFDQLHRLIEAETGFYLSLGPPSITKEAR